VLQTVVEEEVIFVQILFLTRFGVTTPPLSSFMVSVLVLKEIDEFPH
jgi:hypothetical protein